MKGGILMKKRIALVLLLCVALLLSFAACGRASSSPDASGGASNGMANGGDYGVGKGETADNSALPGDRKIITTVNERVETEEYDALIEGLKTAVDEEGGYFVSSSYSGSGAESKTARYASFEIRIPAEKLASFTGKVGALGTVLSYNERANDITLAYVDIESRIGVLEAEETALLAMLSKATTTSESLEVKKYLSDVQGELASLRAQKKTYDTLVAYSTVHLSVNEVAHARAADDSFFSEVGDEFVGSLAAIGSFFRGVGVFLLGSSPVLLLLAAVGVGVFFLARYIFRRESKKLKNLPRPEKKPEDEEK